MLLFKVYPLFLIIYLSIIMFCYSLLYQRIASYKAPQIKNNKKEGKASFLLLLSILFIYRSCIDMFINNHTIICGIIIPIYDKISFTVLSPLYSFCVFFYYCVMSSPNHFVEISASFPSALRSA